MMRRTFLHGIGGIAAMTGGGWVGDRDSAFLGQLLAAEKSTKASKRQIDDWINDAMARAPSGTLTVSRFADSTYFLREPISWTPDQPGDMRFGEVTVPTGFVTDFASIPAVFWSILPPDGTYVYAAIIHDYLYWTQDRPREEGDAIFDIVMEEFDVGSKTRATIYLAVRNLGQSGWDSNTELKNAGEKRILKKFPTDPRVTWSQWKEEKDVFL